MSHAFSVSWIELGLLGFVVSERQLLKWLPTMFLVTASVMRLSQGLASTPMQQNSVGSPKSTGYRLRTNRASNLVELAISRTHTGPEIPDSPGTPPFFALKLSPQTPSPILYRRHSMVRRFTSAMPFWHVDENLGCCRERICLSPPSFADWWLLVRGCWQSTITSLVGSSGPRCFGASQVQSSLVSNCPSGLHNASCSLSSPLFANLFGISISQVPMLSMLDPMSHKGPNLPIRK